MGIPAIFMYLCRYFPNELLFECAEDTHAVSHRQNRQPVFRMNCWFLPIKISDKTYNDENTKWENIQIIFNS